MPLGDSVSSSVKQSSYPVESPQGLTELITQKQEAGIWTQQTFDKFGCRYYFTLCIKYLFGMVKLHKVCMLMGVIQ